MSTAIINANPSRKLSALTVLNRSAQAWFVVAVAGQLAFVIYIVGFYWLSAVRGDHAAWAKVLPHGMIAGDVVGNIALWLHIMLAAVITFCGPLQLVPGVRNLFPLLHRWNGRIYMVTALTMSIGGLYMVWTRGVLGNLAQHLGVSLNGVLIMLFAVLALYQAASRNFTAHRRWALRLFLAVSGVWFFRVGLMFWLTVNQGPVGIDFESFTGPFLNFLAFANYLLPLAVLELYFRAQQTPSNALRWTASGVVITATLATAIGIVAVSMGMWLPRISGG